MYVLTYWEGNIFQSLIGKCTKLKGLECAREDSNFHDQKRSLGPQPSASTNSATCAVKKRSNIRKYFNTASYLLCGNTAIFHKDDSIRTIRKIFVVRDHQKRKSNFLF